MFSFGSARAKPRHTQRPHSLVAGLSRTHTPPAPDTNTNSRTPRAGPLPARSTSPHLLRHHQGNEGPHTPGTTTPWCRRRWPCQPGSNHHTRTPTHGTPTHHPLHQVPPASHQPRPMRQPPTQAMGEQEREQPSTHRMGTTSHPRPAARTRTNLQGLRHHREPRARPHNRNSRRRAPHRPEQPADALPPTPRGQDQGRTGSKKNTKSPR